MLTHLQTILPPSVFIAALPVYASKCQARESRLLPERVAIARLHDLLYELLSRLQYLIFNRLNETMSLKCKIARSAEVCQTLRSIQRLSLSGCCLTNRFRYMLAWTEMCPWSGTKLITALRTTSISEYCVELWLTTCKHDCIKAMIVGIVISCFPLLIQAR